jgi:RNA polymerase sigma-70 factor (ECF subfamily)
VTNFSRAAVSLHQNADEEVLIQQVVDGDVDTFGVLVQRYERVVFSVAYRMLRDRAAAQDAAQVAFIRAFEKLATFDRHQHRFFSWIYRIVVNECLNQRRKAPTESLRLVPPVSDDPGEGLDRENRRAALRHAIDGLVPEQRDVIVLRHYGDCSYDEIAVALGIPVVTVKSRLYAARQRLADMLAGLRSA